MINYNPQKIEKKWQDYWEKEKIYQVDLEKAKKPYYNLMMFPYPSAEGLHIGNVYAFTGSDIHGRFRRMQGYEVFEPIGFDAFGIHSENFAIKQNTHPKILIPQNIENFRLQLKRLGAIYDWSHEVDTTNPNYYKWTQWLFLQLFRAGLAYRKRASVDWCPSCKTVLADEQVIVGKCERCDTQVIQKETEQWFLKITNYTERLLKNLDWIDWSETTKIIQRNWIGRSEGATIKFKIQNSKFKISVFTTRTDTLFGCTYVVIAPEHPFVASLLKTKYQKFHPPKFSKKTWGGKKIKNIKAIEDYIEKSKQKIERERISEIKDKTGIEIKGIKAINPANSREIPIFIADYVLLEYGTGAIMAVPGHDQRDFDFAKKHNLPIIEVISSDGKEHKLEKAYEGEGILINSGKFDGTNSEQAKREITKFVKGKKIIHYHLRDWLISRQRYWGPPIPIIYCQKCGIVPVPEKDLPVFLPDVKDFRPTGTGKSPLASVEEFVNTTCPKCLTPSKRETDVSDTFLDSSWYFLRYPSTQFNEKPFDKKLTKKWLPVDMYIGGQEHACLHLLYARFITMALNDLKLLDFEEPFKKFRAHGIITKNGAKMSKSRGNVVNPDEYFEKYGADCLRMYLMFMGPFSGGGDWQDASIQGVWRFLNKVWDLSQKVKQRAKNKNDDLEKLIHKTIKKVTEDLENLQYNTAISSLMILLNEFYNQQSAISKQQFKVLVLLLAPFAPYISEELWQKLGHQKSIFKAKWPKYNPKLIKEEKFLLIIQINGKVRDKIEVEADISEKEAKRLTLERENVKKWLRGKKIKKTIFIPKKLINIVTTQIKIDK